MKGIGSQLSTRVYRVRAYVPYHYPTKENLTQRRTYMQQNSVQTPTSMTSSSSIPQMTSVRSQSGVSVRSQEQSHSNERKKRSSAEDPYSASESGVEMEQAPHLSFTERPHMLKGTSSGEQLRERGELWVGYIRLCLRRTRGKKKYVVQKANKSLESRQR
jgi:hypothetical protein